MSQKIKLLVVDDQEAIQFIYEGQLNKEIEAGIVDLYFFPRAQNLLEFLEKRTNDSQSYLLITDISMPGMDGITMAELICSRYPTVHIYLSSAYNYSKFRSRLNNCAIRGFFQKPIDFSEIRKAIYEHFYEISSLENEQMTSPK